MRLSKVAAGFLGGVIATAVGNSANATPIACTSTTECDYSLDNFIGTGTPGPGPYGTLTLTQDGSNIDVAIALNPNIYFAVSGAGYPFVWSFNGDPPVTSADIQFTGASIGVFALSTDTPPLHADGSGYWDYAIDCSACGNGASLPHYNSLTFIIDGHSLSDFVMGVDAQGNSTYDFATDICAAPNTDGSCGATVDVTADLTNSVTIPGGGQGTQVPEPISLAMFGTGLAALAAMRRRKNRAA